MNAKDYCLFTMLTSLLIGAGCSVKQSDEIAQSEEQMRAVQLAMDVRVFDSIVKGETNSARELLAIQIDHNIRQLYIASKGHPLDKDSSSLYRRALDYWAKSPILSLQTNSSEGIKIPSIIQESK